MSGNIANRSKNWLRIIELDKERKVIEQRFHIWSAIHHGKTTVQRVDGTRSPLTEEDTKSVFAHRISDDAGRYIEIQNEQWRLMSARVTDEHLSVPG